MISNPLLFLPSPHLTPLPPPYSVQFYPVINPAYREQQLGNTWDCILSEEKCQSKEGLRTALEQIAMDEHDRDMRKGMCAQPSPRGCIAHLSNGRSILARWE